ncbi:MAG TPA: DUF1573 domain-containing protein [Polyangiaceae bacterium]|nr:DUF1573 domain-containing protein [Polyangiaceae bacterium]
MRFRHRFASSAFAFALTALALGAIGCRSGTEPELRPTPSLVCAEPRHDFGAHVEGERLTHVFELENRGKAPLRLLSIEKSYSCAAGAPPASIAPGGRAKLEISCDMSKRPGRMADEVVVRSNDPHFPNLKLELRAEVQPLLAFEPSEALLEPMLGETQVRELLLVGKLAPSARLTLIESDDPTPRIELLAPTERDSARLRVTLKAARVETRVARVRISTGLSEPKELVVLVTWRVGSSLEIDPSNPYFNLREPPPHELTLRVKSRRGTLLVQAVQITEGPFEASLEPETAAGIASIRVRVLDHKVPPGVRGALGKLLIVSNDPAEPRKVVPLFALGVMAKQ